MKDCLVENQFIETIHKKRGLTFARIGMMVEVDGNIGTIIGSNSSGNLDVVFDNHFNKWGKDKYNCHPTWKTKYFDPDGNVVADFTIGGIHGSKTEYY